MQEIYYNFCSINFLVKTKFSRNLYFSFCEDFVCSRNFVQLGAAQVEA